MLSPDCQVRSKMRLAWLKEVPCAPLGWLTFRLSSIWNFREQLKVQIYSNYPVLPYSTGLAPVKHIQAHGCRSVSLWWRIPFTNVSEWRLILHQCFSSENDPSPKICGRSFTKDWWRIHYQRLIKDPPPTFWAYEVGKWFVRKGRNIYMVGRYTLNQM